MRLLFVPHTVKSQWTVLFICNLHTYTNIQMKEQTFLVSFCNCYKIPQGLSSTCAIHNTFNVGSITGTCWPYPAETSFYWHIASTSRMKTFVRVHVLQYIWYLTWDKPSTCSHNFYLIRGIIHTFRYTNLQIPPKFHSLCSFWSTYNNNILRSQICNFFWYFSDVLCMWLFSSIYLIL